MGWRLHHESAAALHVAPTAVPVDPPRPAVSQELLQKTTRDASDAVVFIGRLRGCHCGSLHGKRLTQHFSPANMDLSIPTSGTTRQQLS